MSDITSTSNEQQCCVAFNLSIDPKLLQGRHSDAGFLAIFARTHRYQAVGIHNYLSFYRMLSDLSSVVNKSKKEIATVAVFID